MNFDEAIGTHAQWKTKLRALISGTGDVDVNTVASDTACVLGSFIQKDAAKYADEPSFKALKAAHAAFHRIAGQVAQKAKAGQREQAGALLDSKEYQAASQEVARAITAFRQHSSAR